MPRSADPDRPRAPGVLRRAQKCEEVGLPTSGAKPALIGRLREHFGPLPDSDDDEAAEGDGGEDRKPDVGRAKRKSVRCPFLWPLALLHTSPLRAAQTELTTGLHCGLPDARQAVKDELADSDDDNNIKPKGKGKAAASARAKPAPKPKGGRKAKKEVRPSSLCLRLSLPAQPPALVRLASRAFGLEGAG